MKGYKEDSTHGSSVLMPKTYKRDAYVQVWLDSRHLAVLSDWLDNNEMNTKFLSDVVRLSLEQLVSKLISSGLARDVKRTINARKILELKYNINLNVKNRGSKNLLHNLILDEQVNTNAQEHDELSIFTEEDLKRLDSDEDNDK